MSLSIEQQLKHLKVINKTLKQLTIVKEHLQHFIDTMNERAPTPKPREVTSYEEEEEQEEEQEETPEELVKERNDINKFLKRKSLRDLSEYNAEDVKYFKWLHAYTETLDKQIEDLIYKKHQAK